MFGDQDVIDIGLVYAADFLEADAEPEVCPARPADVFLWHL